ncbi:MAG TPA: hypothetical protein VE986_04830 [Hyphomicrobiales bacterium]|nr:hypothetical protein [Hyphomicrobiales bacterium]
MKRNGSKQKPAVIRAWTEGSEKKVTIQIEDDRGEPLAFIKLSPEKASDLADSLAIYAAKLRMAGREKNGAQSIVLGRPAFLC